MVSAVDLFTNERIVLHDAGIAGSAGYRDVLLGRPMRFGDERLLAVAWQRVIGPSDARRIRDAHLAAEGPQDAKTLADPDRSLRLLDRALQPPAPEGAGPEGIFTTDGDPMIEVQTRFEVDAGPIETPIAALPNVLADGGGRFT